MSLFDKNPDIYPEVYALAAMAPDVPEWFNHEPPPHPKSPDSYLTIPEHLKSVCMAWDADDDLTEAKGDFSAEDQIFLKEYQDAYQEFWDETAQWKADNQEARFFQWKVYFATKLIEQVRK